MTVSLVGWLAVCLPNGRSVCDTKGGDQSQGQMKRNAKRVRDQTSGAGIAQLGQDSLARGK